MAMMQMRDRAQGRGGKIIGGAIIIVMALFGFGAFTSFVDTDPSVVDVNGEAISQNSVVNEADRRKRRILSQMGDAADPSLIDDNALQQTVVERLIDRAILLQFGTEIGLAASDVRVDKIITAIPAFQIDGVFSADLYRNLIANDRHTPISFRTSLRESLILEDLQTALFDTQLVMDWELKNISNLLSQTRDIAFLTLNTENFTQEVIVDQEAIADYFDVNASSFRTQESIDISYVQLSVDGLMQDSEIIIDRENLLSRYEEDKLAFAATEARRTSHILLGVGEDRSEAEAITLLLDTSNRIQQGESFETLAESVSEDPGSAGVGGDLGYVTQGAMVPAFEDALWMLKEGEISAPVVSEFGVHLIKLIDIRLDEFPVFEEQQTRIEQNLRREQAEELFAERIQLIDDLAFQEPDTLNPVIEQFGLELNNVAGVVRGMTDGLFSNAALIDAAFSSDVADEKFNSKTIQIGETAYWIRSDGYYPALQKSMEDVSDEIRIVLVAEAAQDKVDNAVDDIIEMLESGEGSATVAAKYSLDWKQVSAVKRNQADTPRPVTLLAFSLPKPEAGEKSTGKTSLNDGSTAIVTVTSVVEGDIATLTDKERGDIRSQLERSNGQDDFQALHTSLKAAASISRR